MSDDILELTPFSEEPSLTSSPILPDISKQEPLGSGIVKRILGQGGMANVYEVWVPQLEVSRAVKIIKPESSKDAKERFQTEIRILAKLTHPNIVDIHNVGEWKGMPYIEMEKIDGVTLDRVIYRCGALSSKICTAVGILVCRALAFAHAHEYVIYGKTYKGIIHRDLKPGNIMICQDGILKLMDFGIARPVDASFHTIDGEIVGTIQYMSPELLKGDKLDFRTDIYALGATLYEILTGINAFPEPNFSKLVTLKQKNQFHPLKKFKIRIPARLRRLIHKCMQEDPKKRIDSTEKLLYELERIHRQMTHELPEEILRQFYSEEPGKKSIPAMGRIIPWKTIVALPLLTVVLGFMLYWGISFVKSRMFDRVSSRTVPVEQVEEKKPPSTVDTEVPDKIEKSDMALQKPKSTIRQKEQKTVVPATELEEDIVVQPETEVEEQPKPITLVERLSKKYGTTDVLEIIEREYAADHLTNALDLYDRLPRRQASQIRAKIYKMRILQRLGKTKELGRFLSKNNINDGEFILAKAKFAYNRNEIIKAKILLQNCLNAPKQFIDYNTLKQQVYYYKALCASKLFDREPTELSYLRALEEWRNLGALFSNNRTHKLFQEYRKETRRIGEKYRATKE